MTIKGALTMVMLEAGSWRSWAFWVSDPRPSAICCGDRAAMTGAAMSAAAVMRERRETIFVDLQAL
jgi:hypothetical protein